MGVGYVEYSDIKPLHREDSPIEVKCYSNGLWWVCPDPRNPDRCAAANKQYSIGMYITYETIRITQQQLEEATKPPRCF